MTREETFLNMALDYKKQYKECAWWKFRKRNELYKSWQSEQLMCYEYDLNGKSKPCKEQCKKCHEYQLRADSA